ncbi:MAG: glycosyltransferase [Phycisphaerales bacterium]
MNGGGVAPHPRRIVMLNDIGFSFGAGGALRRQVQSLMLDGHDVSVVCGGAYDNGRVVEPPPFDPATLVPRGRTLRGRFLGVQAFPREATYDAASPRLASERVIDAVAEQRPDLVIAGNIHAVGWSVSTFERLADRGVRVAAYLHDMHLLTGRCAAAYSCTKYLDGCDDSCPSPDSYPRLAPARISSEWLLRRRVFCERGVPLVANSSWTHDTAVAAFAGRACVDTVRLGLDERRFAPIDRSLCRSLLKLDDAPTVGFGAVDPAAPEKGAAVIQAVIDLLAPKGVRFVAFGFRSSMFRGARALGFIDDERVLPAVYSALDCYLTASAAESFGQTALEASACGVPVVALRRGGLVDIARDGVNGRTFDAANPAQIADAVHEIVRDAALRDRFGAAGRAIAEREYSLSAQAAAWRGYIDGAARGARAC